MTKEEFKVWVDSVGGTSAAAKLLEMAPAQVSNYIHGHRNIGPSLKLKLNQMQVSYGISQTNTAVVREPSNATILSDEEVVWIQLYERKANAGNGIDIEANGQYRVPVLRSDLQHPEKVFAIKIRGDSMQGVGITEDSVLFCERVMSGDIEKYVNKIVLVGYEGAAYVKRLIKKRDKFYLHSETAVPNKYEDIDLHPDNQWQILAVVVTFKTYL